MIYLVKVKVIVNGGFEMISTLGKQKKYLIISLVAVSLVAIASGVVLMVFNTSNSGNTNIKYATTFFLRNEDSKYALFNEEGERLTEFVYTSPSDFMNGTAEVSQDDKVGIIDEKGKMTVDFGKYDSITSKNGVYEVRDKDSKSYLINGNGKVLYNLENASLHTYTDSDYYSILEDRKAKKYYVLGSNGEELESFNITSNEDVTTNAEDNFASIFYNGENYIFDLTTGKEIITFNDSEHYCVNRVSDDRKTLILNSCGSSNNGNAIYKILVNNKLIDISNECDNSFFKDGKIICTKDYEEYLLDSNYKRSISTAYISYEDDKNYAKVNRSGNTSVEFYNNGSLAKTVACRTVDSAYITNGLYLLQTFSSTDCGTTSGIYEFYNNKGERVFDKTFVSAKSYDINGNAIVSEDKVNYYLIDSDGKQIGNTYSKITSVVTFPSYYIIYENNLEGLLNSKGEEVLSPMYQKIQIYYIRDIYYAVLTTTDSKNIVYDLTNNKEIVTVDGYARLGSHYIYTENNGGQQYYSYKNGKMFHEV